jgi:MYND finger
MAPVPVAQCANCGTDAAMRCAGCIDAPEYQPGDPVGGVYCSRDCQRGHWSNHKAHCRTLGQRKKLLRTANILRAALLTYREVVYDIDLTKIEIQDGILYLYQNQRPITARSKRGLFPGHLTTNIEHKEAALANNQCTTAMALLGRLTRKLLNGETFPQDYNLGKLGFTFGRGGLDYRSIGPLYRKAVDSNKTRPWSGL